MVFGTKKYYNFQFPFLALTVLSLICSSYLVLDPNLISKACFLVIIVVTGSTFYLFRKDRQQVNTLVLFCFGYLLYSGFVLFLTSNFSDAIIEVAKDGLFLWVIYLLSNLYRNKLNLFLLHLRITFLTVSSGIIAYGLYQYFNLASQDEVTHLRTYAVASLLGHRNIFSQFLLLSAFINAGYFFYHRHNKSVLKALSAVIVIISIILMIMLQTRTVWVASAISLMLMITWAYRFC